MTATAIEHRTNIAPFFTVMLCVSVKTYSQVLRLTTNDDDSRGASGRTSGNERNYARRCIIRSERNETAHIRLRLVVRSLSSTCQLRDLPASIPAGASTRPASSSSPSASTPYENSKHPPRFAKGGPCLPQISSAVC